MNLARWKRHRLLLLLLSLTLTGCGGETLSATALAARRSLWLSRPQQALDQLSESPPDKTAAGHYLRACALEQLQRTEAAAAEAQLAIQAAPKNPKYQSYALRLKLFDRDESAIEPILKLHEENPSSAAIALHAVYAFQAKHVKLRSEGKTRGARVQLQNAEASLKTALSLAAEIPECHRELIGMAIWFELPEQALTLVDALLREEPDNVTFLEDRVKILLLAGNSTETISTALKLYKLRGRTEPAAVEFADILNRLPPTPAAFDQYDKLREQFPSNLSILLRHCWSIGKAGRVEEACQELRRALDGQTDPRRRKTIAQSAIAIPLEMQSPQIAAAQLKTLRDEVGDPQMLAYFEGQLAAQQKNYTVAVEKMQAVVNAYRTDYTASEELARSALGQIRRVLSDKNLAEQIRKAAELTLRRSGLDRFDELELRQEARSLLNVLEDAGQTDRTPVPTEGPQVIINDINDRK
jgi:predicted Zn-dependent protease